MDQNPTQARIYAFWSWFLENQAALAGEHSELAELLDELLEELHLVDPGLYFEIESTARPRELVLTAAGHEELFPLVESLVASAPSLEGWEFTALKPAMGFAFRTNYEGVEVDPQRVWFLPMLSASNESSLGLRIGIPDFDPEHERQLANAVLVILDTALGERAAAADIQHVEVGVLPAEPEAEGYMELVELPAYIEWKKRRGPTSGEV